MAAHGARLMVAAIVIARNRHQAEDLFQTALAKAYANWGRIERADALPYVRRILLNAHYDWWKRIGSREQYGSEPMPDPLQGDVTELSANRDLIVASLRRLTQRERSVIAMRFLFDLTEVQTAAELAIPIGSVKSLTARGLKKLRNDPDITSATSMEPSGG